MGSIVEGIENIERVNTEYGEHSAGFQQEFGKQGNPHAEEKYPNLDRIHKIIIISEK